MNGTYVRYGTGTWDVGTVHKCHWGGNGANHRVVKRLVRRLAYAPLHTDSHGVGGLRMS